MDVRPEETLQVRLRCFGELEVVRPDGTDVTPLFLLPRRAALFLYPALADPPQPIPRAGLAEMFRPFLVTGTAEHALDQSLFSLRQYLGDVWDAVDDAIVFVREPVWCDVWAFREAITREDLERAIAVYRGPLLARPELFGAGDFQTWVERERDRLRRDALRAFSRLAAQASDAGDWWTAVKRFRRRLEVRFGRAPDRETSTLAEIVRRGATPPLTPFLPF